jgi:hypothetical protein
MKNVFALMGLASTLVASLWGRTEEGGRAVLRDEPAMVNSTISWVRATPLPSPPPQEGAGALTPSTLSKSSRL